MALTSNSGAGLQPGHVAMHTDASNIQANCFAVRGIIPELTGLGVHRWNWLRQAGATLLGSECIFIIGIAYGLAVVGSEAKFPAEANLAFPPRCHLDM
jgi:hypothetical protein